MTGWTVSVSSSAPVTVAGAEPPFRMDNVSMEEAREGAVLPGIPRHCSCFAPVAHSSPYLLVNDQPLRHRIQAIIDRRFYRSKYDSAKIVAAFSSALRQEVDLDTLREHLLAVVQETMQPAHVSLWLRQPEHQTNENLKHKEPA